MKLRFAYYLGAFVVLLCGSYIAVRFFGAPGYVIQLVIAFLFVVIGIDAIVIQIAKTSNKGNKND
jgi:hypothetical protein